MRIAVVGAAGKTGSLLIKHALQRNHDIIGVARNPERIPFDEPQVIRRQGDGFERQSIVDALEGADAVVTSVGKTNLRDPRYHLSTATHENVLAGMRQHGIRRLIAISSIGAAKLKRKGIRRNIYLFLRRKYYGDMNLMEQQVLDSEIDVTVLRAPMLHNGPAQGAYQIVEGNVLPAGRRVSRADLADFILDDLETGAHVQKIVAIADDDAVS